MHEEVTQGKHHWHSGLIMSVLTF